MKLAPAAKLAAKRRHNRLRRIAADIVFDAGLIPSDSPDHADLAARVIAIAHNQGLGEVSPEEAIRYLDGVLANRSLPLSTAEPVRAYLATQPN
ncbi:hypothetical protein [Streptomyces sp. NEAU-H3]|uniref:hypothetical protein n=1 Tax=Streptomyces sp. NEAU-H3 TaxID=2720636 RepID=UPI00143A5389|nr:hypothetical protein [Streptomyces sp. NEAU-H3]NJA56659.1 hypothetical protein [Streptomyces sp. NEAU-H3]